MGLIAKKRHPQPQRFLSLRRHIANENHPSGAIRTDIFMELTQLQSAIFALQRAKFAPQAKLAIASEIACGQLEGEYNLASRSEI